MSKSLLNPKAIPERLVIDNIKKAINDLQINSIVRSIFIDVAKQKKILEIFEDLCTDKETILYRQSVLRDFMYNRNLFYSIQKITQEMDKCFSNYNALVSSRLKVKSNQF